MWLSGPVLISYPKGRKDEFAQRRTLLLGQYPPHLGKLGQRFGAAMIFKQKRSAVIGLDLPM